MTFTIKQIDDLFQDIHQKQNQYGQLHKCMGKNNKSLKILQFAIDNRTYLYMKNPSWANTLIVIDGNYHRKNQLLDITDMQDLPDIKLMGLRFIDDKSKEDLVTDSLKLNEDIILVERGTIDIQIMSQKLNATIQNKLNAYPSDDPDYLFKYEIADEFKNKVKISNNIDDPERIEIECLISNQTNTSYKGFTWNNGAIYSNVLPIQIDNYFKQYKSVNVHNCIMNTNMRDQSDLLSLLHDQYQLISDGRDKFNSKEERKSIDELLAHIQEQVMKLI